LPWRLGDELQRHTLVRLDSKRQRVAILTLALICIALIIHEIFGDHGYLALRRQQRDLNELERQIQQLQKDNQQLESQIKSLKSDPQAIEKLARDIAKCRDVLYLGRGTSYPIALEGALKLKEISYLHAEGYPAGELKHGPLALVDSDMPVVTVAPNNDLLEQLKSNLMEVRARGGELIVFADPESGIQASDGVTVIEMPRHVTYVQAPVVYSIPLQLLAYHAAILKGTDVDQPRNLAKSVTVE